MPRLSWSSPEPLNAQRKFAHVSGVTKPSSLRPEHEASTTLVQALAGHSPDTRIPQREPSVRRVQQEGPAAANAKPSILPQNQPLCEELLADQGAMPPQFALKLAFFSSESYC